MYKFVVLLVLVFTLHVVHAASSIYYPSSITDVTSSHSTDQGVSVLSVQDQTGTQNDWNDYIEFDSTSRNYQGIFNFIVGASSTSITGLLLEINFLGDPYSILGWYFEVYENAGAGKAAAWVKIGDTTSDTTGWDSWKLLMFTPASGTVDYTRIVNAQNVVQIRMTATGTGDTCDIDFVQLTLTTSSSTPSTSTTAPTTMPTTSPTNGGSHSAGVTRSFNLRVLILAPNSIAEYDSATASNNGGDLAALAFDTVGMPYDFVVITSSTSLSSYLSTSGIGLYSAIVSIGKLSTSQLSEVTAYQVTYGVRYAVIASSPNGLHGVSADSAPSASSKLWYTLAPQAVGIAPCLNPNIKISNTYTINWSGYNGIPAAVTPAVITDTNSVTPVIMATDGVNQYVAAVIITMSDGTKQLHYFMSQAADYIFTMAFSPILVNWLAPGGLFIGSRRLTLAAQADDLLLASNLWDTNEHTDLSANYNYRITADDLQNLADFYDALNVRLPAGSYVTVEWPTNFGGVNDWTLNGAPDLLYARLLLLQQKFYYLSHTWDHPCPLDNFDYAQMSSELTQNINFLPQFFSDRQVQAKLWTSNGMISPCITGLHNPQALQAMVDNGIIGCVSDNSITSPSDPNYEPFVPYHGQYSTLELNGFEGMFFVPRQALDINYGNSVPAELVDEYNYVSETAKTFEEIMAIEAMYAIQDKVVFRHDPFMFHQANARSFMYNSQNYSLLSLWTERVVNELMSYYTLPITHPQMRDLITTFQQRTAMDSCGITTTLGVNANNQIVSVNVQSQQTCEMALSGVILPQSSTVVKTETVGVESTSFITLSAGVQQSITLPTPLTM